MARASSTLSEIEGQYVLIPTPVWSKISKHVGEGQIRLSDTAVDPAHPALKSVVLDVYGKTVVVVLQRAGIVSFAKLAQAARDAGIEHDRCDPSHQRSYRPCY